MSVNLYISEEKVKHHNIISRIANKKQVSVNGIELNHPTTHPPRAIFLYNMPYRTNQPPPCKATNIPPIPFPSLHSYPYIYPSPSIHSISSSAREDLQGEENQEGNHEGEQSSGLGESETKNGVGEKLTSQAGVAGYTVDQGGEDGSDTGSCTDEACSFHRIVSM